MISRLVALGVLLILAVYGCNDNQNRMNEEEVGVVDGQAIIQYQLKNSHGMVVKLINYGAIITSIMTPNREGHFDDVVLGFDSLDYYWKRSTRFGATVGRVANRIRNAQFESDDLKYELTKNSGDHCIHGGYEYNTAIWSGQPFADSLGEGIYFTYTSPDGAHGFPGKVDNTVTFQLSDDNALRIRFQAITDRRTPINMTQHSYFNLSGCKRTLDQHQIVIDANQYVEVDEESIPTGELVPLAGTPRDLSSPSEMGAKITALGRGFDYCYASTDWNGKLSQIASVLEPVCGRTLKVFTTQPGAQFYTAKNIDLNLLRGQKHEKQDYLGFCLETQHFPDSPNHPNFPSVWITPDNPYDEQVIYQFGIAD